MYVEAHCQNQDASKPHNRHVVAIKKYTYYRRIPKEREFDQLVRVFVFHGFAILGFVFFSQCQWYIFVVVVVHGCLGWVKLYAAIPQRDELLFKDAAFLETWAVWLYYIFL